MFLDPAFWLAISFLIFVVLMIKYALPLIIGSLDTKAASIAKQIADAKSMREQAEKLLKDAKKYHEESLLFSQKLIEDAKIESSKLLAEAQHSLEVEVVKKTTLAKERIKSEEEKVIREIKSGIIDAAIKVIENKATSMPSNNSSSLIKKSISDISKTVH